MFDRSCFQNQKLDIHADLENIKCILQKNYLIENIVKTYLNNNCCPKENDTTKKSYNVRYYRLPFTDKFSEHLQHRLNNLIKNYCKTVAVKIVFKTFKIGQAFSNKDSIPSSLKSTVAVVLVTLVKLPDIYQHVLWNTWKHKNSHVYKHLQNNQDCFNKSNSDCFSTPDTAETKFML